MKNKREPRRFPLVGGRFARAWSLSEQVGISEMITSDGDWEAA
jgi:hypothetical protein